MTRRPVDPLFQAIVRELDGWHIDERRWRWRKCGTGVQRPRPFKLTRLRNDSPANDVTANAHREGGGLQEETGH
jgi:hypothetical protein